MESQAARQVIWSATKGDTSDNWSYAFRQGDQQRFVRSEGAAGTTAVKGRARYPYVEPLALADPRPIPDQWE